MNPGFSDRLKFKQEKYDECDDEQGRFIGGELM